MHCFVEINLMLKRFLQPFIYNKYIIYTLSEQYSKKIKSMNYDVYFMIHSLILSLKNILRSFPIMAVSYFDDRALIQVSFSNSLRAASIRAEDDLLCFLVR